MRILSFISLFIYTFILVEAAPYYGKTFSFYQPDGTQVRLKVFGDEYYSRAETPEGYTVIRDEQSGWICYASLSEDGNELISTGIKYLPTNLKSIPNILKGLKIDSQSHLEKVQQRQTELGTANQLKSTSASYNIASTVSGDIVGLTLVIDFSDKPGELSLQKYDDLCNLEGYNEYGNKGSVRDYYKDISGGLVNYTNKVFGWYRASKTFAEYDAMTDGKGTRLILSEALEWLKNQGFDFSTLSVNENNEVLAVNIIHTGNPAKWSEGLWWHQGIFSGFSANGVTIKKYNSSPADPNLEIATICHENGHMLCNWPDTYKYDYSLDGIDEFDLMCRNVSTNPSLPNPKYRNDVGWAQIIDLSSSGQFVSVANDNIVYKYTNPNNAKEYYLFENRLKTGRSANIPDEGLTIWHVDEDGNNQTSHEAVKLVNADGRKSTAMACYESSRIDEFNAYTYPAAEWYADGSSELCIYDIGVPGNELSFKVSLGDTRMLNKSQWILVSGDDYNPENAFDKDCNTPWRTSYSSANFEYPHELVIDLQAPYDLTEFNYLLPSGTTTGMIKDFELYATNDLNNWGNPVATGIWDGSTDRKTVFFNANGRYFKFKGLSEVNGKPIATAGEITLYGTVDATILPLKAYNPKPANEVKYVDYNTTISWHPGIASKHHRLYFGSSSELIEADFVATLEDHSYELANLVQNQVYYWRIDEANDNGITQGDVWQFQTREQGIFTDNRDIGVVPSAGSFIYENGTYTVHGSGPEVGYASDNFHFVYTPVQGDCEFIAKVNSVENGDVGIVLRNDIQTKACFMMTSIQPDHQAKSQYRNSFGGAAFRNGPLSGGTATGKYLRLVRKDNIVKSYYSSESNSGPWLQIGLEVAFPDFDNECLAGLYVCSNNISGLNTATFTEVSLKPYVSTNLDEDLNGLNINLYPNPTNGILNVTLNTTAHISIYDVIGQCIYQDKINSKSIQKIDLSQFNAGLYIVVVRSNNKVITRKIQLY